MDFLKDFTGWMVGGFSMTAVILFSHINSKIDTKADKVIVDANQRRQEKYDEEISHLYSRLNDAIAERRAEYAHLIDVINANHIQIIQELNKKVDRDVCIAAHRDL
jgi:molybdopterin converting factor small subunit